MKRTLCILALLALVAQAHAAPDLGKALEGTNWRWDTYKLKGVTFVSRMETPVTLRFFKSSVSWIEDCNGVIGRYILKNHRLSVPHPIGTQKFCGSEKSAVASALGGFMKHGVIVKLDFKNGLPSELTLNSATSSGVMTLIPAREKR